MVLRLPRWVLLTLHLLVHLLPLLALGWLVLAANAGLLGGDPVPGIIHWLGKGALNLLLLCLLVSPLAKGFRQGGLMRLRRPLGLWALAYATLHVASWMLLDLQLAWGQIGSELVKRNYIVLGMAAWLILLVLGVTSWPRLVRKMGRRWQTLHRSIYLVALLVPVHYWWSLKSGWQEPAIYLLISVSLLAWRHRPS